MKNEQRGSRKNRGPFYFFNDSTGDAFAVWMVYAW